MRSASTILTFGIIVFPIILISTIFAGIIIWHEPTLEASVTVETISALTSVVLVDLLVWERLRDSLSKKLEYTHENYLSKLHEVFKEDINIFAKPQVEKINSYVRRYGKFLGIALYPRDLPSKIDRFMISYEELNDRLMKIEDIGKKCCEKQFDKYLWYHLLGIETLRDAYLQSISGTPVFKLHEDEADTVGKEQAKLIEETKACLKKAEGIRKEILEKLEDFLRSNNLEFEPKLVYDV